VVSVDSAQVLGRWIFNYNFKGPLSMDLDMQHGYGHGHGQDMDINYYWAVWTAGNLNF
jgi:hypothetical protein